MTELETTINDLIEQFGHCKVNLVHPDGMNEGIWAVPLTAEDRKLIDDDDSNGDLVKVLLCNQPLGWYGRAWGDEVTAMTQGDCRPIANWDIQPR